MELRKYTAGKDVEGRRNMDHEQWHGEESSIERLKGGVHQEMNADDLSDYEKKQHEDSKQVWTANNTFMWDWDGINANVKRLAKHRQPNLVTKGIAEQYHGLLTPPLTASCGHRCLMARARMARETESLIHRLGRYYGTYYGPSTNYPEGITSANVDAVLKQVSNHEYHKCKCCRCQNSEVWFGLGKFQTGWNVSDNTFYGLTVGQLFRREGFTEVATLRMGRGAWQSIATSPHYYANVLEEQKIKSNLNVEHIGWHAGLLRPRLRWREEGDPGQYSNYRPLWFSNIRLADKVAVISGLHNPKRYLCPNCFTAAKGLPPHLYWQARGYSVKAARAIQAREYEVLQGRGKRWLQSTVLDVKDWAKLGPLYA